MCGLASGLLNSSVLFLRIWRVEDDYFSSLGCKKGATVVRLWTSRGFIVALSYSSVFLGGLFLSERLPLPPVEYGSVWSLSEQTWHADLNKHTWPQHGAPCAVSPRREKGVFTVRVAACVWSCGGWKERGAAWEITALMKHDAPPGFSMFAVITLDYSTFSLTS